MDPMSGCDIHIVFTETVHCSIKDAYTSEITCIRTLAMTENNLDSRSIKINDLNIYLKKINTTSPFIKLWLTKIFNLYSLFRLQMYQGTFFSINLILYLALKNWVFATNFDFLIPIIKPQCCRS